MVRSWLPRLTADNMPRPSIYQQVSAVAIGGEYLKDSPRCWNPGMFRYANRLWLCYRYHLMKESGRCVTAICRLDEKTLQPAAISQRLMMAGPLGTEHHEDARLFIYQDKPYISYTEMTGYRPGVDYSCRIRYSQLKLQGNRWSVLNTCTPNVGKNWLHLKEKNWVFFDYNGELWCIYRDAPDHVVVKIKGDSQIESHATPPAYWPWGEIRGGSPPIKMDDGNLLCVFHSSIPTEDPPHYVRYYAGVYIMEGRPPFRLLKVSRQPLMVGSEVDGHQIDPRYVEGWKPYVVFPGGIVRDGGDLLISVGVNDWQSAVARVSIDSLDLMEADGSNVRPRYFRRPNGTMPVRIITNQREPLYIPWIVPRPGPGCSVGDGYMKVSDPRHAQEIAAQARVEEIKENDYATALVGYR